MTIHRDVGNRIQDLTIHLNGSSRVRNISICLNDGIMLLFTGAGCDSGPTHPDPTCPGPYAIIYLFICLFFRIIP